MSQGRSYVVSIVYGLGLVALFVGERLIGFGTGRGVLSGLGVALVVVAAAWRLVRRSRAKGDARRAEAALFWMYVLGLVALGLYVLQSDLLDRPLTGALGSAGASKLTGALAALWPAVLAASVFPVILIEFAYASMAMAPVVEYGRVRDALLSGLGLAFALVFAFSLAYVADQRDAKVDLSYFRTAKPGEATRKLVRGLEDPVDISLFFPPGNEVHGEVKEYFNDLAKESPKLRVANYDQAVDLAKAKELGVSGNGAIVVSKGGRREQFLIGLKLEQARSQLRSLDQEVQKRLLAVARSKRTVYLTAGHGERSDDRATATDQRPPISALKQLLQAQNYELRTLSSAEGLASDIPRDAAAVLIIGPTSAFLPEEAAALERYLDNGGRALIAVDPETGLDFKGLLAPLGLQFTPVMLASDQAYVRRRYQPSDRTNIGTASYSSHPSVTTLSQLAARAPLILLGAGPLELAHERPSNVIVDFTVHSHPSTWNDVNGNFELDPPAEARKSWELAAAVTKRKPNSKDEQAARVIVVGDSDLLTDVVIENPGNAYFALDGMKWLLGEEALAGQVSSEVDVPIEHTRKQDVFWFYSTIFLVPAVVLGAGFAVTRRKSRQRPASAAANAKERT